MKVRCIEQLQTKHITFKPGEEYFGSEVNKQWWVVDSVGVETDNFHLHFEVIEKKKPVVVFTEREASAEVVEEKKEEKIEEKPKWYERLRDYIFA
jgi:hypothetical protein